MHEYNYSHWLTTTYVNGAGLFAGEIKLSTCCVAMMKLWGESCRVVDGSAAPDWPKSTPVILVLPLVEWIGCRAGVQAIVARQNWNARALRRPQSLLLQTQRSLMCIRGTDQNNSIHPLRKNINVLPCPHVTFYYVILEKPSYWHEDTQLHTLVSYVLLAIYLVLLL